MKLILDKSLVLVENIDNNGIQINEAIHSKYATQFEKVTTNLIEQNYSFSKILYDEKIADECIAMFNRFNHWAKTMVVVGIGGSDLGSRMLKRALGADKPPMRLLFAGDSTDPEAYRQIFAQLDAKSTLINVVSKSGSTLETASGYLLMKKFMQDNTSDWNKHFIFTTSKGSVLDQEAKKENIVTLEHDPVGGRYSVLSKVGLFPALAVGINIKKLVSGARQMNDYLKNSSQEDNFAWNIGLSQYLLQKDKNINTVVMMPYIWRMDLFANWYRQLLAESVGKDNKGILPIRAIGPADQHSQVQFYNQGKALSSYIFIKSKYYYSDIIINSEDNKDLNYLHMLPMEDIIKAECDATSLSLAKNGRPSMTFEIESLDEEHLGALILIFELGVVYLAKLLDVDPFNQPGVEAGKEYMYGLLGRSGFENYAIEIEKTKQKMHKRIIKLK